MRRPRFRLRTLMALVLASALVLAVARNTGVRWSGDYRGAWLDIGDYKLGAYHDSYGTFGDAWLWVTVWKRDRRPGFNTSHLVLWRRVGW
jgi:hypothetical protein